MIIRIKNLIRNINYLSKHSLWDQRESDIAYITNKILDDVSYEYGLDYPGEVKIKILSTDATIDLIKTSNKSFIRTGDGEIALMQGKNHPFQNYNEEIVRRLIKAIENPPENLLVGLNRMYFVPLKQYGECLYYRRHAYDFREFYKKHCSKTAVYIDACCTGIGEYLGNHEMICAHYARWRNMFAGKDLMIVCGKGLLDEYEYDIFELAKSKKIVECPRTNAWIEHDSIMEKILSEAPEDKLIVFILGQAGKAMITELVEKGYICWDVGHLAKYYDLIAKGIYEASVNFYAPD